MHRLWNEDIFQIEAEEMQIQIQIQKIDTDNERQARTDLLHTPDTCSTATAPQEHYQHHSS